MRSLMLFADFIKSGLVRKGSPDVERAKSLVKEAREKRAFYEKLKEKLGFDELTANYVLSCEKSVTRGLQNIFYLNPLQLLVF